MQVLQQTQDSEEIIQRLIVALAEIDDSDPLSMNPPLYDVVGPDALGALLTSDALHKVEFSYKDHTVVIDNEGTISINGTQFRGR